MFTEQSVESTRHVVATTEEQHYQTEKTMETIHTISYLIKELDEVINKIKE